MDKILAEVQNEYTEIQRARVLMVQSDFSRASEIYANVLSQMAEKEAEDSLKMSVVYLEYAKCLIMSNDKLVINPEIEEDNEYLDDLGIAWELLEIAKSVFKKHNFIDELINVHLLLSDISQESNNFTDSLEDLLEVLRLIRQKDSKSERLPNILLQTALMYEALNKKEEAISMLESIIEILSKEEGEDARGIISEVQEKINEIKNPEKYKLDLKQQIAPKKIDITQPIQKIQTSKKKDSTTETRDKV